MTRKGRKKKQSYGGCTISHLSAARADGWPKAINIVLGFEEALKLQLALHPVERLRPYAAMVGSSNFTGPGLATNRELNLVHRVFSSAEETVDHQAAQRVEYLREGKRLEDKTMFDPTGSDILPGARVAIKSEVGGRAVVDLVAWFARQWERSSDFKDKLNDLLNTSKFGQHEYTPYVSI